MTAVYKLKYWKVWRWGSGSKMIKNGVTSFMNASLRLLFFVSSLKEAFLSESSSRNAVVTSQNVTKIRKKVWTFISSFQQDGLTYPQSRRECFWSDFKIVWNLFWCKKNWILGNAQNGRCILFEGSLTLFDELRGLIFKFVVFSFT